MANTPYVTTATNFPATIAAVATTAATTTTPYGFTTATQPAALIAAVNSILAALKDRGIIASS